MDTTNFKHTRDYVCNHYKVGTQQKIELLTQKGQYPYEYMQSFDNFRENKLPDIEAFYSTLSKSGISDSDYKHAETVWETFKISNMGEYHDLYLKSDVLLLSDVFEKFRDMCLDYYTLDPAHYFTSPGLSWDACLKMTKVNLNY
jgi:alpha-tubulin suppressor-like RCC1 family protein